MDKSLLSSPSPFTPPTTEGDRLSWLRLIRSRRVGPATFHRLLHEHGSAQGALDALPDIARAAGLTAYEACPEGVARAEIAAARKVGARMICHGTPDYPPDLMDLPDAPPLLWATGNLALLRRPMIAIVGARSASSLGVRMARKLAEGLGAEGIVVVSGLARGIDAAAHAAALAGGTVAVFAGGVDVIYPTENAELAARIAAEGACLSELPIGFEPQARHFPQRNRIVSGLSVGVVVVEAATGSGSLITARTALDQGREVMAVPGHPVDARAAGCNTLIRDGATLIRSAQDVIEAVGPALAAARAARSQIAPTAPAPRPSAAPAPTPTQGGRERITAAATVAIRTRAAAPAPEQEVAALRPQTTAPDPAAPPSETQRLHNVILSRLGPSPVAEDQLIRDLALPVSKVATELLALELEGWIERQPGGLLARIG